LFNDLQTSVFLVQLLNHKDKWSWRDYNGGIFFVKPACDFLFA